MTTQMQTETLNGIDVAALQKAIDAVTADPDAGQTRWSVTSRWQDGTRTDHFVKGFQMGGEKIERQFKIEVDEPHELCGSNEFANPQEYLLAATNACMMVGYTALAALMGIRLTQLELELEGDIDLRGFLGIDSEVPNGYERLHCRVQIAGDATEEQFEQLHEMVQRTSPNYYNISRPVELSSELIVAV